MKKHLTLKNLGWILSFIVSIVLFSSAISKAFPNNETIANFTSMNMLDYLGLIAFIETSAVLMFLTNRFVKAGAALISVIMGAAISSHIIVMNGVGVEFPISMLILTWFGYVMREYSE
jgi:hypothetical protein